MFHYVRRSKEIVVAQMLPKLREMNLSDCNAFKEEDGKNREELPLLQPKLT